MKRFTLRYRDVWEHSRKSKQEESLVEFTPHHRGSEHEESLADFRDSVKDASGFLLALVVEPIMFTLKI